MDASQKAGEKKSHQTATAGWWQDRRRTRSEQHGLNQQEGHANTHQNVTTPILERVRGATANEEGVAHPTENQRMRMEGNIIIGNNQGSRFRALENFDLKLDLETGMEGAKIQGNKRRFFPYFGEPGHG